MVGVVECWVLIVYWCGVWCYCNVGFGWVELVGVIVSVFGVLWILGIVVVVDGGCGKVDCGIVWFGYVDNVFLYYEYLL